MMVREITYLQTFEDIPYYFMSPTQYNRDSNIASEKHISDIDQLLDRSKDVIRDASLFRDLFGFPKNRFSAVEYVMKKSNLIGKDKLVALTIAGFYSEKGYSYPNIDQISKICKMSERSVSDSIKSMKLSGEWLISPSSIVPYEKVVSNRYYLLPPVGYGLVVGTLYKTKSYRKKDIFPITIRDLYKINYMDEKIYNQVLDRLNKASLDEYSSLSKEREEEKKQGKEVYQYSYIVDSIANYYKPNPRELLRFNSTKDYRQFVRRFYGK